MTPSNQDIPQKIQELQSAQSQIRFWRTLSIVAVILIVVTCVGLISTAIGQLTSAGPRQQAFLDDLVKGINQDVVPELQRIGTQAAADVAPIVQNELQKLNAMAPEFAESLRSELYALSVNVSEDSEQILDDSFRSMIEGRRQWIEKNFADVTDDKVATMLENLSSIAHERIEAFSDAAFAQQIIALNRITENLQTIQQSEMANVSNDVPTWEMGLLFFDIIRDDLARVQTLNTETSLLTEEDRVQIEAEASDE
jgi:hypothetical protein